MNPDIRPRRSSMPERTRQPIFTRPMQASVPRPSAPPVSPPPQRAVAPTANHSDGLRPKHRLPKKLLLAVALIIVAVALAFAGYAKLHHKSTPKAPPIASNGTVTAQNPTTIRFIATGDFIAHDSVNTAAQTSSGSYNYLPLMQDFVPIFKKADIKFCNDPILNGGKQFGIDGYPQFNSPTEFVTDMGKLGCNLVGTASNHSFDKTQDVITASVNAWKDVPNMLAVAGQNSSQAEHDTVHYFTVSGIKFAFLAYTTYSNSAPQNGYGVNVFTRDFAGQQIATAKQNGAQIIIASMRWGTEYSGEVNAEQKTDAQWLADQGVNLILGHGPHVLQTVQELTGSGGNKTLVWYSLGNFVNTQEPPETLFNGLAVMNIHVKTKAISIAGYLPVYMHYEWTAVQAAADDIAARNNLHLYLLDDATDAMVAKQQLKTTIAAQKQRLTSTLTASGLNIPLLTPKQYLAD